MNQGLLQSPLCDFMLIRSSSFLDKLRDGRIKMLADDWCTFLYEDGVYDEAEIDKGLLRGYFLLRVWFVVANFQFAF
jgi:hypothetical protein